MDRQNHTDGLQQFLKRRYLASDHIPSGRIGICDALRSLGSAVHGRTWLGNEIHLVEPDADSGDLVRAAWQRRSKTVKVMKELLETEIVYAFTYTAQGQSESELGPSIWSTVVGEIALDSGEVQLLGVQRWLLPYVLLIDRESFEMALASLPLSRAIVSGDADAATKGDLQRALPPRLTYGEVLGLIERCYIDEGVNYLKDWLIDALMTKRLIAYGQRRSRSANERPITAKSLLPVEPLVWGQDAPKGIGQFLRDPAGDRGEGWLNVSLIRADVLTWLKAEGENSHLQRLKKMADPATESRDTLDREERCRRWLEREMCQGGRLTKKARSKTLYRSEAVELFGISFRQFYRAWDNAIENTGAKHWSGAGRPAKE